MTRCFGWLAGLLGVCLLAVPVVGSEIMLDPAPCNGWATAGYAINQAAPPEGTYQIAVGQTFRTPDVAEPKVALTGRLREFSLWTRYCPMGTGRTGGYHCPVFPPGLPAHVSRSYL